MTTLLLITLWVSAVFTSMGLILFVLGAVAYYFGREDF